MGNKLRCINGTSDNYTCSCNLQLPSFFIHIYACFSFVSWSFYRRKCAAKLHRLTAEKWERMRHSSSFHFQTTFVCLFDSLSLILWFRHFLALLFILIYLIFTFPVSLNMLAQFYFSPLILFLIENSENIENRENSG